MVDNRFTFYGQTDVGKKKENNEDAFVAQPIWNDNFFLAVVIDGVGGYDGGEVAAEIAQKEIPSTLEASSNGERIDLLAESVTAANNAIFERRNEKFPDMSCVLSAVIIDTEQNQVNMIHVGDTRVYQFHDSELRKLSHDHSVVGYMEEIGRLTEEQAMNHPERNVISRDVGSMMHRVNDDDFIESNVFPLLPNTVFLLCSDGLTDLVTSAEIISVLEQKETTLEQKVHTLVDLANEKGGKDNITVVLVEYKGETDEPVPQKESENTEVDLEKTESNVADKVKVKNKVFSKLVIIMIVTHLVVLGLGVLLGFLLGDGQSEKCEAVSLGEQDGKMTIVPVVDSKSDGYVNYDTIVLSKDKLGNVYYSKYEYSAVEDTLLSDNWLIERILGMQEKIDCLTSLVSDRERIIDNLIIELDKKNKGIAELSTKQREVDDLKKRLAELQKENEVLKNQIGSN